jgi:hypothetical protein
MSADIAPQDRRYTFTPPPRPDWVAKVNEEGRHLDIKSIVPLDADSLIKTAVANTGLTNFGSDDWRVPFDLYCQGMDDHAELTLMGRIMTRSDLLVLLEGRLHIEEVYRLHPEIEQQEIVEPVLIVGQGRSGTSAMVNLLAQDPNNAVELTWQTMFPTVLKDGEHKEKIKKIADARMHMLGRVTPEVDTIHEWAGGVPTECIHVQCLSLQGAAWMEIYGHTPNLFMYLHEHGYYNAVAYEKRVLKLWQWHYGKTHWILKSPDSMRYMQDTLKVFPDVNILIMHRDPVKSFASAVNMAGTFVWARSDHLLGPGSFDSISDLDVASAQISQPIECLAEGLWTEEKLCNVQYLDFVADPLREVERVYAKFGRTLTPEGLTAMQDYIDKHPRTARPAHKYKSSATPRERAAFRRYQEYFNVPSED